jgi:cytochrome b6-f complex iron-sulfur subunit
VEWDHSAGEVWCPCHGSRFSTKGAVLQGPATVDLTAFEVGERDGMLWVKRW